MKKFNIVLTIFNLALLAFIGFFLVEEKLYSPENVFKKAVDGVLETRAVAGERESAGSAVVINDAGELITNYHVVSYKQDEQSVIYEEIYVRLATEEEYHEAEVIKFDEHQDLALLKVTDETYQAKLKKIRVAKGRVKAGATCYSVGNMSNQGISISKGIISSESISIIIDNEARKYIQAQINIALGSSGGALLDSRGKLIGITTLRLKDRYGNPQYGYGYSIPISVVLDFLSG
jgi:serine protease DegS